MVTEAPSRELLGLLNTDLFTVMQVDPFLK